MPMLTVDDLERDPYLRLLVMGPAKVGKSAMCVATAPGPVAILLCEADSALRGPKRHSPNKKHFGFWRVRDWDTMQKAVVEVSVEVKEGRIKTVVVDPLSEFATNLEAQCLKATNNDRGEPDGRRAYPEYNNRLRHLFDQLFRLKAHLIVITHYIETGGTLIGDQLEKTGQGIVPLLAGKARALVAAKFNDVVWMEIRKGERVFVTGPEGAWGPGCRSIEGTQVVPADIGKLIKLFDQDDVQRPATQTHTQAQANRTTGARPNNGSTGVRR